MSDAAAVLAVPGPTKLEAVRGFLGSCRDSASASNTGMKEYGMKEQVLSQPPTQPILGEP